MTLKPTSKCNADKGLGFRLGFGDKGQYWLFYGIRIFTTIRLSKAKLHHGILHNVGCARAKYF